MIPSQHHLQQQQLQRQLQRQICIKMFSHTFLKCIKNVGGDNDILIFALKRFFKFKTMKLQEKIVLIFVEHRNGHKRCTEMLNS